MTAYELVQWCDHNWSVFVAQVMSLLPFIPCSGDKGIFYFRKVFERTREPEWSREAWCSRFLLILRSKEINQLHNKR